MAASRIARALWLLTRVVISLFAFLVGTLLFAILVHVGESGESLFVSIALTWICLRVWAAMLEPGRGERWKKAVLLVCLFPWSVTALPFYLVIRLCCTDRVVRWMGADRSSERWTQRISSTEATLLIVALLVAPAGLVGYIVWGQQAFFSIALYAMVLAFTLLVVRYF